MASNLIVCGGTFDHFHKGHEAFLSYVFSVGKKIIVGVTSDEYVRSSKFPTSLKLRGASKTQNSILMEDYEVRKKSLEKFLVKKNAQNRIEILKIEDLFGPTLSKDLLIDAIVVSLDSKKGADVINGRRKELGLEELKIIVASQVLAEDGKPISSKRIRNGEVNRAGRLYVKPEWFKTDLVLPCNLRRELQRPFGEILTDSNNLSNERGPLLITVGDATTKRFNDNSVKQKISVVDFKIARKEEFSSFSQLGFEGNEKVVTANNPAGHITSDLFNAISEIFKAGFERRIVLRVIGEEDLAVLPLILAAPLGAIIYYGQPGQGIIKLKVSEEIKEKTYRLANNFEMLK